VTILVGSDAVLENGWSLRFIWKWYAKYVVKVPSDGTVVLNLFRRHRSGGGSSQCTFPSLYAPESNKGRQDEEPANCHEQESQPVLGCYAAPKGSIL